MKGKMGENIPRCASTNKRSCETLESPDHGNKRQRMTLDFAGSSPSSASSSSSSSTTQRPTRLDLSEEEFAQCEKFLDDLEHGESEEKHREKLARFCEYMESQILPSIQFPERTRNGIYTDEAVLHFGCHWQTGVYRDGTEKRADRLCRTLARFTTHGLTRIEASRASSSTSTSASSASSPSTSSTSSTSISASTSLPSRFNELQLLKNVSCGLHTDNP
ncbi:unnamed protein product, partial [Amoebophrya sp. A25]|eukprot:GSA25T00009436001.1